MPQVKSNVFTGFKDMIKTKKPESIKPIEPPLIKNVSGSLKFEQTLTPSLGPQKPSQDPIFGMQRSLSFMPSVPEDVNDEEEEKKEAKSNEDSVE